MPETDPPPASGRDPRAETRRIRRLPAKGGIRLRAYRSPLGLGPNIGLRVLDVSAAGARVVLSEALPDGHEMEVTLEGPSGAPCKIACTVVWSAASGAEAVTGLSFNRPLDHSVLAGLARC